MKKPTAERAAPGSWAKYKELSVRLDGKVNSFETLDNKPYQQRRIEFKHNGTCRLLKVESLLKGSESDLVFVYNPVYAFSLSRKDKGHWVVRKVEARYEDMESEIVQSALESLLDLRVLVRACDTDLIDLVGQSSFRVSRASTVKKAEKDLARIEFDNSHPTKGDDKPFCPIQGGSMLLDPDDFWCLHSGVFQCRYGNADAKVTIELTLAAPSSNFPLPKRLVQVSDQTREKTRLALRNAVDFDFEDVATFPDNEAFKLSAFGLPEPTYIKPKRSWPMPYVWIGALGVICVIIGLAFRRLRSRAT